MKRTPLKRKTPLKSKSVALKRSPLRQRSKKFTARASESRSVRDQLIAEHGCCMLCGASEKRPIWPIAEQNRLCCHELLNGPLRQKVLDEPSCLIVACWRCNQNELNEKGDWPLARQLAVIKEKAPHRYDLQRVLELRDSRAMEYVTEEEVDRWIGLRAG